MRMQSKKWLVLPAAAAVAVLAGCAAPYGGGYSNTGYNTAPPPGYQTPSVAAPYGIGRETPAGWKIPSVLDRPVGGADN